MAYQPQYPNIIDTGSTNLNLGTANTPQMSALDSALSMAANEVRNNSTLSSAAFFQPYKFPLIPVLKSGQYGSETLGYDAFNPNLEAAYAEEEGTLKSVGKNLLLGVGDFGKGFIGGTAFFPLLAGGMFSGEGFGWLNDSALVNRLNELTDSLSEMLPSFESKWEQEHPILKNVPLPFLGGFEAVGNLAKTFGYVTGSLASGVFMGNVFNSLLPLANLATVATNTNRISSLTGRFLSGGKQSLNLFNEALVAGKTLPEAVKTAASAISARDKLIYELIMFNSAGSEAMLESSSGYQNTMNELEMSFYNKYGKSASKEDLDEMKSLAQSTHKAQFLGNLALLYTTNKLTFGDWFKPTSVIKNEINKKVADNIALTVSKNNIDNVFIKEAEKRTGFKGFLDKTKSVAKPLGSHFKKALPEMFEENIQLALETGATDFALRKYNNDDILFVDNLWKASAAGLYKSTFSDEGLESMFLGGMVGFLSGAGQKIRNKKAGLITNPKVIAEDAVKQLNIYNPSTLFNIKFDEAVVGNSLKRDMDSALEKDDMYEYRNLKHKALFNYVNAGLKTGNFDLQQDRLKLAKELQGEEFLNTFGYEYTNENKRTAHEYIDKLIAETEQVKKDIENVDTVFSKNPFNPTKQDEAVNYKVFEDYKDSLKLSLSEIRNKERRISSLTSEINEKFPSLNVNDVLHFTNNVGYLTKLEQINSRIKDLKELEKQSETSKELLNDFVKERQFLEEQWEKLNSVKDNPTPDALNDIFNYYANGNKVGGIINLTKDDITSIYNKAYDIEQLAQGAELGTVAYEFLRTKGGYEQFRNLILGRINDLEDDVFEDETSNLKLKSNSEKDNEKSEEEYKDREREREVETKKKESLKEILIDEAKEKGIEVEEVTKTEESKLKSIIEKEDNNIPLTEEEKNLKQEKPQIYNIIREVEDTFVKEEPTPAIISPEETEEDIVSYTEIERRENEAKSVVSEGDSQLNFVDGSNFLNTVLFKVYSNKSRFKDENSVELINVFDKIFSRKNINFLDSELHVYKSTKGLSTTDYRKIGNTPFYKSGFGIDARIIDKNKKPLGLMVPADTLYFRNNKGQYIPLQEITKDEYEKLTGAVDYENFMDSLTTYTEMWNNLLSKLDNEKLEAGSSFKFKVKALQNLFDLVPVYGSISTSKTEETSTLLKDLKYFGTGSAILSFPKTSGIRTGNFTILNEKSLTDEQIQDVYNFLNSDGNINKILKSDRRYIVLNKMPNNKFSPLSILYARPTQLKEADSTKKIKLIDLAKEGDADKFNEFVEQIYIADGNRRDKFNNPKKFSTNLSFHLDVKGDLLFRVSANRSANLKAFEIRIPRAEVLNLGSVTSLVDVVNNKLNEAKKSKNPFNQNVADFNILLRESDFKSDISNDPNVSMSELKDYLQVSTTLFPYKNFGVKVKPKKQINPPEPDPKSKSASIPLMITKKMEKDLKDLGYEQEDIDKMKPQEAWDILKNNVEKGGTKSDYSIEKYLDYLELIRIFDAQNTPESKRKSQVISKNLNKNSENYKTAKYIQDNIEDITNQIKNLGTKGIVQANC